MYNETRPYYDQMGYGNKVLERFWSKVDVKKLEDGTDDLDACMEWDAYKDRDEYGRFGSKIAHRFIYECFNGPIPQTLPKLQVRHTCDNPPCVNPRHLLLGTIQDDANDRVSRNRQAKGSGNGNSKLIENQVLEIKDLLDQNTPVNIIAKKFNVVTATINHIKCGKRWSHITNIKNGDYSNGKLNKTRVLEIKNLLDNGLNDFDIAKKFELTHFTIYRIRCGKNWSHITKIKKGQYTKCQLNKNQILEIKRRCKTEKQKELAKEFGISQQSISKIKNNKMWKDV